MAKGIIENTEKRIGVLSMAVNRLLCFGSKLGREFCLSHGAESSAESVAFLMGRNLAGMVDC